MKFTIAAAAILLAASSFAQQPAPKKEHQKVKAGFGVTVVQTPPEFPGGPDSLAGFIRKKMVYPEQAKLNGVQGRVYIGFLVDKTGKIKNIRMLSGVNEELNNEALRVAQLMPDWTPGSRAGSNVDVQYILPIDFIVPPKKEHQ